MTTPRRDLRDRIAEALDAIPDEQVRQLVADSLLAEKTVFVTVTCKNPKCAKSYRYPVIVPNLGERAKVLDILATQSKGKPAEAPKQPAVDTALIDVEGMSLAELEAEEARLLREFPELADRDAAAASAQTRRRRRPPAR